VGINILQGDIMEYIIAVAATIFVYIQTIQFNLVIDDVAIVRLRDQQLKAGRPLKWSRYLLYGAGMFKNIGADHAFTIFVNCLIACLATYIFSLPVALAFITLPANNQILIWLNGRRYQVAILAGLITFTYWPAGILLFPLALYNHVSALPIAVLSFIFSGVWALLMLAPSVFALPKVFGWLKGRWAITPEPERRRFHPGKIIMAIKNLADYWVSLFFYPVFRMYHPKTWGIVEHPEQKQQVYSVDRRFWGAMGVLLAVHLLPMVWYGSWFKWALLADLCVVMWLGFWKNPVQYWAPRYAGWFYLIALVGLSKFVPSEVLYLFAAFNAGIIISNLEGYRDIPGYFWNQCARDPHNMHIYWSTMQAFAEYARVYSKKGMAVHALQYRTWTAAVGFLWCARHPQRDIIHDYMTQLINDKRTNDDTSQSKSEDTALPN